MNVGGHPALGALCGLLFGLFLAVDLLLIGTIRLDSALVGLLPVLGLIVGAGLGWLAPLKMLRK